MHRKFPIFSLLFPVIFIRTDFLTGSLHPRKLFSLISLSLVIAKVYTSDPNVVMRKVSPIVENGVQFRIAHQLSTLLI